MSKELLHTPEGVRDVYGKECARKLTIENKINNIFNLYGFHNVHGALRIQRDRTAHV